MTGVQLSGRAIWPESPDHTLKITFILWFSPDKYGNKISSRQNQSKSESSCYHIYQPIFTSLTTKTSVKISTNRPNGQVMCLFVDHNRRMHHLSFILRIYEFYIFLAIFFKLISSFCKNFKDFYVLKILNYAYLCAYWWGTGRGLIIITTRKGKYHYFRFGKMSKYAH